MIYCQRSALYLKFVKKRPPWEVMCRKHVKSKLVMIPVKKIHFVVDEWPPPVEDWAEWCAIRSIPFPDLAAFCVDRAWLQSNTRHFEMARNQKVWFLEEEYYKFTEKLGIVCRDLHELEHAPKKIFCKRVKKFLEDCRLRPGKTAESVHCWYFKCLRNLRELPSNARRHCSGCGYGTYCDRQCQKLDWPQHKLHCASLAQERRGTQDATGTQAATGSQ